MKTRVLLREASISLARSAPVVWNGGGAHRPCEQEIPSLLPHQVHRTDTKEETKAGETKAGTPMGRASDFIPVALAAANGIERAQAQPSQRLAFDPARC